MAERHGLGSQTDFSSSSICHLQTVILGKTAIIIIQAAKEKYHSVQHVRWREVTSSEISKDEFQNTW